MIASLALGLHAGVAAAQDGFDAHGFRLAAFEPDVRDPLTLQRPDGLARNDWFAGALLEFANEPLVLTTSTPTGQPIASVAALDDLVVLDTSAGFAPHERFRVDLSLPVALSSQGADGPQGTWLGDTRIAVRALLVDPEDAGGMGLGVVPYADLPTGRSDAFLGSGAAAGGADLAGTAELGRFTATGQLGVHLGPTRALGGVVVGDALTTGLALGWAPTDDLGFTAETHLSSPFEPSEVEGAGAPSEVLLSGRKVSASGGHALGGLALATSRGVSAAEWRLFVGGGFGSAARIARPEPEPVRALPKDTLVPAVSPRLEVVVTRGGAPVEGAELTVEPAGGTPFVVLTAASPFTTDARPQSAWAATARLGCLAGDARTTVGPSGDARLEVALAPVYDALIRVEVVGPDGEPVPDARIDVIGGDPACPARGADATFEVAAGSHEVVVRTSGYGEDRRTLVVASGERGLARFELAPSRVELTERQIVIREAVLFETGQATILPVSFGLLDDVAKLILDHPSLQRVEVAGHTDGVGSSASNLDLSQRRADAVRAYLVEHGVDAARLVAKGYGEGRPMFSNQTDAGRAKNRRVEFNLP